MKCTLHNFKVSVRRNFLLLILVLSKFFPGGGSYISFPVSVFKKVLFSSLLRLQVKSHAFLIEMILSVCKILNRFSFFARNIFDSQFYCTCNSKLLMTWHFLFEGFFINFLFYLHIERWRFFRLFERLFLWKLWVNCICPIKFWLGFLGI